MTWLQRRPSGQYRVRLVIPPRLRSFFNGQTILTKVLGTADPQAAKRKAVRVVAELQRRLQEAEAALTNPAVAAYHAVQAVQASNLDDHQAEALDSYLTTRMEEGHPDSETYRAVVNRNRVGREDNPPLSILVARWERETRPTPKTAFEWRKIRERFTALALGSADFPVRQIERRHVLAFKDSLLGLDRSPATISKALAALKSVFGFGINNGLLVVNPAAGVRMSKASGRVFPGVATDALGTVAAAWTKWYGRWARTVVSDRRKVFHSWRHLVEDRLRDAGAPDDQRDALLGHSSSRMGRRYGRASRSLCCSKLCRGFGTSKEVLRSWSISSSPRLDSIV